ncbi:MAG: hypothetical protein PHF51_03630 [Candidatus ainarchaeum sp.]|nr:hypothetical protein [Candidatus ainarchaeum sp.]
MRPLVLALVLLALLPAPAPAASEWLDWDWHYRAKIEVSAGSFNRTDWIIEERADFSELLGPAAEGKRFDPDSVRVMEYDSSGMISGEAVSQFDADHPGAWSGDLLWRADGTLPAGSSRTYYVYFDVLENGAKPAPQYAREVVVRNREQDVRVDTSKLMVYMDRTRFGYSHVVAKSSDWAEVSDPAPYDPLENSRPGVKAFRGFVSAPGEHECDPGCEWGQGNTSTAVLHEGPLRATVRTVASEAVRTAGGANESRPFNLTTVTMFYAGKRYYRTLRSYDFLDYPQEVSGLNRRMWIYGYPSYAYASPSGVKEGPFPAGGAEFSDASGTWDDAFDPGGGIANFELSPLPAPYSIWAERDPAGLSYLSSLWRPNAQVSRMVAGNTVFYFHDGDWRQAGLPERYAELAEPPAADFGSASSLTLEISAPETILNWNPTLPLNARVLGNMSPATIACKVRSMGSGETLFAGVVGDAGVSVFGLPDGQVSIECIASEAAGNSEYATAQTRVYDVMSLVKVCAASFIVLLLLLAAAYYRLKKGLAKPARGGRPCARCGMPQEKGARACPVCGGVRNARKTGARAAKRK